MNKSNNQDIAKILGAMLALAIIIIIILLVFILVKPNIIIIMYVPYRMMNS